MGPAKQRVFHCVQDNAGFPRHSGAYWHFYNIRGLIRLLLQLERIPWKKVESSASDCFDKKGGEKLGINPGSGYLPVPLAKLPQPEQRFKLLEHQYGLSSSSMGFQNSIRSDAGIKGSK